MCAAERRRATPYFDKQRTCQICGKQFESRFRVRGESVCQDHQCKLAWRRLQADAKKRLWQRCCICKAHFVPRDSRQVTCAAPQCQAQLTRELDLERRAQQAETEAAQQLQRLAKQRRDRLAGRQKRRQLAAQAGAARIAA